MVYSLDEKDGEILTFRVVVRAETTAIFLHVLRIMWMTKQGHPAPSTVDILSHALTDEHVFSPGSMDLLVGQPLARREKTPRGETKATIANLPAHNNA